jgi:hypothetical protein
MTSIEDFETRCENLCLSRGFTPQSNIVHKRFILDFIAHTWYIHSKTDQGISMLDLLDDPSNLYDGNKFNTNFRCNLNDLVSDKLSSNPAFAYVLNILTNNKGKGVGIGEMILPLIVDKWQLLSGSDGWCSGGRRECKNGQGSSLKPLPADTTTNGHIDELNKIYWQKTWPGTAKHHQKHAEVVMEDNDATKKYAEYLGKIYPGKSVDDLANDLVSCINDVERYNWILGQAVLGWYKELDKWHSIVLIHPKSLDIVNIATIDDSIKDFGIKFHPVMNRRKNTQAVSDGFVNIEMKARV